MKFATAFRLCWWMRRSRFSLLAAACCFVSAADLAAQEEPVPASECCLPLLLPIGARPVALGQALTARAGRDGVFINPAGLVDVNDDEFVIHRSTMAEDAQLTTFGLIIHSAVAGVFALTYRLIDFGETDITDESGNVIGSSGFIDQVLTATYATRISGGWSAGISYKLYDFRDQCEGICGERFSGTTHLLDGGLEYRPARWPQLVLGASLIHAGLALQVKNAAQADPTPARLRLGTAYEIGHHLQKDTTVQVWAYADVVGRLRDTGGPALNVGAEVILDNTIFLRAGHASASNGVTSGGTGLGVGLRYQRFDIAVSKTFSSTALESDPVQVSFGVRF
jgi:hypothetical protein